MNDEDDYGYCDYNIDEDEDDYVPVKRDPNAILKPWQRLSDHLEIDMYSKNNHLVNMVGLHEQVTGEKYSRNLCNHEFVYYKGLEEEFNYCKYCNQKEEV